MNTDKRQIAIGFEGITLADANELARELRLCLSEAQIEHVDKIQVAKRGEQTMDLGADLIFVVNTAIATYQLSREIWEFLKRRKMKKQGIVVVAVKKPGGEIKIDPQDPNSLKTFTDLLTDLISRPA